MSEGEEIKNRRLGILSSIGIHVAMLLLFLFAMGWRAPNPPLSDMGSGIELNFGLDDQGGGDIQPEVPVGNNKRAATEKKEDIDQPKQEEKVKEEAKPETTKEETPLTSQDESPVIVKETKKEVKTKSISEKTVETKPKDYVKDTKKEEKKSVKEPDSKKTAEDKKGSPGPSQGDDKGKTGDKGNPQGTLDSKALYGKPGNGGGGDGGGGGGGITVTGFEGFEKPTINKPEIPNESYGTYSFRVKVSKEGEVVSIVPITKGISLEAERIFKQTIETTEFIAKISNSAESVGTITFKVIPPPAKKDQ